MNIYNFDLRYVSIPRGMGVLGEAFGKGVAVRYGGARRGLLNPGSSYSILG